MENSQPPNPAFGEAEVYFENLWQRERPNWLAGEVVPARMENGVYLPLDFCLTTVARLVAQPQSPVEKVEFLLNELKAVGGSNFFYPLEAIHISLLGCTARSPSPDDFDSAKVERIKQVCLEILAGEPPVKMSLKGVGIIGNQVFLQGFPHDRRWAKLRLALEKALFEVGEFPISFPNKAPIHMNILRVTNGDKAALLELLQVVERLHTTELGEFEVALVDFMRTDFVLSPGYVTFYEKIAL